MASLDAVEFGDHLRSDIIRILRINCGGVPIYDVLRSSFSLNDHRCKLNGTGSLVYKPQQNLGFPYMALSLYQHLSVLVSTLLPVRNSQGH